MNSKTILTLACKIFGIFFIFQAIAQLKTFVIYMLPAFMDNEAMSSVDAYRSSQIFSLFISLISILFDLGIAFILLWKADWIVRKLDRTASADTVVLPLERVVLIEITIIAVGIFILATSVPTMLTNLIEYMVLNSHDGDSLNLFWTQNNRTGRLTFSVIETVVALVLVSNGKPIARRLERVGVVNSSPVGREG